MWVAEVHGIAFGGLHEAVQAIHQIADVTEAARLRTIAENRHRLATQRLVEKSRDHAAIV